MGIREGMPLLAKHDGEWEGVYTHVDPDGQIIDQHRSHLSCTFPEDGSADYYQVNSYTWDDGRTEQHSFPATYDGHGHLFFDTDRLKGIIWALDENAMYLTWRYKSVDPTVDQRLFEMIVLDDSGTQRSRTWQWLENGVCVRRTLIQETRISGE
ncbi:DUF3598 family protein [Ornithinimicrobium faecis]|uniref:DUF3598 family protein n=1 Tax=Ornithinimicrobium faecis TaxID=2934158 RepID=UPI002118BC90|nr:DUF3598 family protein [Ornithinimicrobium sp. HY1745]